MSFKAQVQQVGPSKYVLEPLKDMKAPVVAFLSPELFAMTDETLWRQAYDSASYDGVKGVYLMPDTHVGYGIPVGGVVVTEETIIQSGSGYDISCGVVYMQTDLHASDIADMAKRQAWLDAIKLRIASGVGADPTKLMKRPSHAKMENIFRHGAAALGVPRDQCERHYIEVDEQQLGDKSVIKSRFVKKALGKAAPQLGSVGGGNHFIEMQVDDKTGQVWVMVHCGSRGFGWNVAKHFFLAGADLRGLRPAHAERSWLYADEPLGKAYWAWHNAAANYAIANRHTIVKGVISATQEVFDSTPEVYYEISHNLVQEETLVLPDGTTTKGFVHRKGATRAFPAGHPDLKDSKWEKTGHPCLIPGSMYHGAAVLFPKEGAYHSGCSVNHGSGRVLGRGAARRQFSDVQELINEEMAEVERTLGGVVVKGIATSHPDVPLDECAHVYKDLDEVLAVLVENGVATVASRLYPVANLKGCD